MGLDVAEVPDYRQVWLMAAQSDDMLIWCNGSLVPAREIRVSPFDTGFTIGAGVFESVLAIAGEPIAFARHHARLAHAAGVFGLALPALEELRDACRAVASASGHARARVRITVTCGPGMPVATMPGGPPTILVVAHEVTLPMRPAILASVPWRRNPESALSGIKSTSYAENLLALAAAKSAGADEAVMLNTRDELCECATSNLWYAQEGKLSTPGLDSGCLPGVARQILLELSAGAGIEVDQSPRGAGALAAADVIFLTSAIRGVHPVACCDGREINSVGHPLVVALGKALEDGWESRRWS